jgi:hypothetical protein
MYKSIPIIKVKNIIKGVLDRDYCTKQEVKDELLNLTNTILEQNDILFNDHYYKQQDGLAIGAPTSAILAQIFIQFVEHTVIYIEKHQIIDYYRHVDDILIIYNLEYTNIHNTLQEFNTVHPKLKFTLETETHNKVNYLDITTDKHHNKLIFGISQDRALTQFRTCKSLFSVYSWP